ncbi:cobalamin biosynthesis protein CbiG [Streptomyces sp. YC537]|uniref:Cobalamin biosynthesis protein CbiG n=1 Tax=Streptomyces boluensis TaxID=1775135 RepID=A0A964XNW5_9ACTN|nr:cobalamin biosynthesis protein CbiG [Streptomyces boluensis]
MSDGSATARVLVVGVGACRGTPADEVLGLVRAVLREAGLDERAVAELATVDDKAGEPGLVEAARALGVPLVTYPAAVLAEVAVPNPSGVPLSAFGTPSVSEAAALVGGGQLLVPKRKSTPEGRAAWATCAVARRPSHVGSTPPDTLPHHPVHPEEHL